MTDVETRDLGRAPEWLTRNEIGLCPCGCVGVRRRGGFLARTLEGTADVARRTLDADETAALPGALQRLDPRTKVVGLVAMLVVSSSIHRLLPLLAIFVVVLVAAAASRLSVGSFVKRICVVVPLFTAIVVLPATSHLITPGHVVVPLGSLFGRPLGLTSQGLHGAAQLIGRVTDCVSLTALVAMTTPWPRLLGGIRGLGVPRTFVMVTAMAHRFTFTLLDTVTDRYLARRARTVKPDSLRAGREFVGASAGALFGKASQLSTDVHLAMVARGYVGESTSLATTPPSWRDAVALVGVATLAAVLMTVGPTGAW